MTTETQKPTYTITLFAGLSPMHSHISYTSSLIVARGGTSGSVVAARLAEDPNVSVLVIEAGQHNSLLENTVMVGGW